MIELESKQAQEDIFPKTLNELDAAFTAISYDLTRSRSLGEQNRETLEAALKVIDIAWKRVNATHELVRVLMSLYPDDDPRFDLQSWQIRKDHLTVIIKELKRLGVTHDRD